jgi:hypothetical protein
MKDEPNNMGENNKNHPYDDEISLVDIYLTIKRNGKLFLSVVFLTFLFSLLFAYITYSSNPPSETPPSDTNTAPKVEYSLWLEIGKLYLVTSPRRLLLDDPNNAVAKLKNIYTTKTINEFGKSGNKELSLSSVSVDMPKKSELIVLKIIGDEKDSKSYEEVLNTIAEYLLEEHNSKFDVKDNDKLKLQPTRIVQQFKKTISLAEKTNTNTNTNKLFLIPMLGIILGVFLGFLAIFVKGFLKKVKEVEERD